jgi:hypothetical protein
MYLLQISGASDCQNVLIPYFSSDRFCGLYSLHRNSFKVCQTSSIGLRSGLEAGIFHLLSSFST